MAVKPSKKNVQALAPKNQQHPGGDPGPGGKITSARIYKAPSSNLAAGTSAYRGKGK